MVVALVVVFSFLGALPRMVAVVAGGIGFGLFLDEVGKFVTQTNDYFFQPSVAIMYVVVVALLLVNRWIHDNRTQSSAEDLANAAGTAADGLIHGLTPSVSRGRGGSCGGLRRRASTRRDRGRRGPAVAVRAAPQRAARRHRERGCACISPECSTARARCGSRRVALALFSTAGVVNAIVTLAEDLEGGTGTDITTIGQMCGSTVAFVLCWVAIARLRGGRICRCGCSGSRRS